MPQKTQTATPVPAPRTRPVPVRTALVPMETVRKAAKAAGSHFFDRDTMRLFGSRVPAFAVAGPGGTFFATSERPPHGPRAYTVRQVHLGPGPFRISTVGTFRQYATGKQATLAARRMAEGNIPAPIPTAEAMA